MIDPSGKYRKLRQAGIAVNDVSMLVDHGCALLHALDQNAVREIGTLQRVDAMALRLLHDESINGTLANGLRGLLGFFAALTFVDGLFGISTLLG